MSVRDPGSLSRVNGVYFSIDLPSTIELTWHKVKSTSAPGVLRLYQVIRSTFVLTLVRRLVNVNNRVVFKCTTMNIPSISEKVIQIHR